MVGSQLVSNVYFKLGFLSFYRIRLFKISREVLSQRQGLKECILEITVLCYLINLAHYSIIIAF